MSSEIVFTILLQHILTLDQEGGGKSWGEAEVRMMLDQWKTFKCFTQTECYTAALWNDDWKLFSSYYWPPVAQYKSSVDFDSSNPVHHLFLCRISHCWTPPPAPLPPLSGSEPRQYWPNHTPPSMTTISITIFIFIVIAINLIINILFSDQHHDHHDSTPNSKYHEKFPVFFNPSTLSGSDLQGLNLSHQHF